MVGGERAGECVLSYVLIAHGMGRGGKNWECLITVST